MCLIVFLLPVFGVVLFWLLPLPIAAGVYAALLAATALLFRAAKRAADRLWHREPKG